MLASMASPTLAAPLHEQSHVEVPHITRDLGLDERICPGCKKSAVSEEGGLVVAFGQSFFHVDCFKCAKCGNHVTADTNLLLLSDGSPICANCSYSCNVCHLPILDEAIMTGDDSYHAHCFKCKVCKNRIDELVFAKTSQGIYCMSCHNERMIKIRKYTQKKAERERNAGGESGRARDRDARNYIRDTSPGYDSISRPSSSKSTGNLAAAARQDMSRPSTARSTEGSAYTRPIVKPKGPPQLYNGQDSRSATSQSASQQNTTTPIPSPSFSPTPVTIEHSTVNQNSHHDVSPTLNVNLTPTSLEPNAKRRSYDDGVRPLQILFGQKQATSGNDTLRPDTKAAASGSLTVTSRQQKRRSINPGLVLPNISMALPSGLNTRLSPVSSTSSDFQSARSTNPVGSEAGQEQVSRPTSQDASTHSHDLSRETTSKGWEHSSSTVARDNGDQRLVLKHLETPSPSLSPAIRLATSQADDASSRLSSTSNGEERGLAVGSRSNSPYRQIDVPRSIENGSDSDEAGELASPLPDQRHSLPTSSRSENGESKETQSPVLSEDYSALSQETSDDMSESSPVERLSHATFIAPALPPIRFSLNAADFSELLSSVQGSSALKSLDQMASLLQESDNASAPLKASSGKTMTTVTKSSVTTANGHQTGKTGEHTTPNSRVLKDSRDHGMQHINLEIDFVVAVLETLDSRKMVYEDLKEKFDGVKRTSRNLTEGVSAAQAEYDKEQKARRDAEAEVTRLRVLLSGQAAKLMAMSGDDRRQELRQQISKELNDNLSGLEQDLSRLKLERDIALAEVEELSSTKSLASNEKSSVNLGRSVTKRLDGLRRQYQRDLIPLTEERERLGREIAELKAIRDTFLEETTALNARNEELAQLSHIYSRRLEAIPEAPLKQGHVNNASRPSFERPKNPGHTTTQSVLPLAPSLSASTSGSSTTTVQDEYDRHMKHPSRSDSDFSSTPRRLKWIGYNKGKTAASSAAAQDAQRSKGHLEHNFQQISVLRFTRCDHCAEKLWGSQLRCSVCNISIHVRCVAAVQTSCAQRHGDDPQAPLPPSMFGRDLIEQAQYDGRGDDRQVPILVEKCVQAVEAIALDYEGIYRKTGGSSQSKMIAQLFDRGDYTTFDLLDTDRFNDICSVTSVLKNYFRSLPNPLLTFALYKSFVEAISIKDIAIRDKTLSDLVKQLPSEHYYTLRVLMIHLHHVHQRNDTNLMNARNLGVVFGPTLIRSPDPGAEFGDMAQRALFIEWLVENAPRVFTGAA
ncbi:hypothetical protein AGABI1DRAFT_119462 [Agaricus bisporus var. burnettii JB137-S8]|uniref:RhoGAP-domain-containing protein n=1 Tax=Agaricus bisporus var. burnettii (strain JB137-S8 / ATCC MYA-4627 / FGSC 10392) TaxID=597362 RepID=K5WZE6_AGABU|nr:uncharacterized protein AGABI1DRAFT_119462 [Agaricus bisporus var. burnettii JB137-S8]EKM80911.1 hypothetical protein AGABI1DRAFT_119462 [Agaricus bisporus var. burnettii JB137-S8]